MTEQQHPITPPPELVDKWNMLPISTEEIIIIAWRHGADQELEACLDQLSRWGLEIVENLRNTRRPKPPSLAEEALHRLQELELGADLIPSDYDTIRRALERLQELEGGQ